MRKAFAEALFQAAEKDPRVIFLTGDLGFGTFDAYQAKFGPRYVNVGVAEAQLVNAAAGLALEGWRPIIYSIASFATGRPFEQIRISVGYAGVPVVIIGAGGGYTYASSGVTHHAGEDLGLMSMIPGMTVVAPGDPNEVAQLLPQLLKLGGPSYLRVGKYGEPAYQADAPVILGRARLLREGDGADFAVVSTGQITSVVLDSMELLKPDGIAPTVMQFHTVQPLDTVALDSLAEKVNTIIVVEEHMPVGGLAAGISTWRAARAGGPRIVRLGPPQALVLGNPTVPEMRKRLGFDAQAIAEMCRTVARPASRAGGRSAAQPANARLTSDPS
jgi:transketolase